MGTSHGRVSANVQFEVGGASNTRLHCGDYYDVAGEQTCGPSLQVGAETRYRLNDNARGPGVEVAGGAAVLFQDTDQARGSLIPQGGVYFHDGAFELGAVGGPRLIGPLGFQVGAVIAYRLVESNWALRLNLGVNGTMAHVKQEVLGGAYDDVVLIRSEPDTNRYMRFGLSYNFWTP